MENQELIDDLNFRKQILQKKLIENNADACIVMTGVNIFYLTGLIYDGFCYVPNEGDLIHFVKRPENLDLVNTIYIRKPEQIAEYLLLLNISLPQNIFLESDIISYNLGERLMNALKISKCGNASTLLRSIRAIKTDFEITQIKKCALKHQKVYKEIPSLYKRGMTDLDLQIEIERIMRKNGSLGIFRSYGANMDIFMGSLLTGENAETSSPYDFALGGGGTNPILPLGSSGISIKEGQTIMVDMAGNYTPWMTDMTRVFSVGKTTDLAYKAHQISIEIHNSIIKLAKPGANCSTLYDMAIGIADKNGLSEYFMGTRQQAKFVGHGLGLEINEPPVLSPRSKDILEKNIVFALEPKFVIPNIGAVGIENTYLVNDTGVEKITLLDEEIIEL